MTYQNLPPCQVHEYLLALVTSHYRHSCFAWTPIAVQPFCAQVTGGSSRSCRDQGTTQPQPASKSSCRWLFIFMHRLRNQATTNSQKEKLSAPIASLSALCLTLWMTICLCLIAILAKSLNTHCEGSVFAQQRLK